MNAVFAESQACNIAGRQAEKVEQYTCNGSYVSRVLINIKRKKVLYNIEV